MGGFINMYLITWEVKETFFNGFVDVDTVNLVCDTDQELIANIDEVLYSTFPANPNIRIYNMEETTGKFASIITELSNTERLQKLKDEDDRKIKEMFAKAKIA